MQRYGSLTMTLDSVSKISFTGYGDKTYVKMHWMGKVDRVSLHCLDIPKDPLVFLVDFEDIHLLLESVVAVLDVLQCWLTPVDTDVGAVDEPLN